jgi:hypothetical protein
MWGATRSSTSSFSRAIKAGGWTDYASLDIALRDDLDGQAPRAMAVVDPLRLELVATPEAVVGRAKLAKAGKTIRAVVAICEYLDLLCDHVLATWPAGTVPDPEATTFRTREIMEPYLKEPAAR